MLSAMATRTCWQCGYDLAGLDGGVEVCPECAERLDASPPMAVAPHWIRRGLWTARIGFGGAIVFAGSAPFTLHAAWLGIVAMVCAAGAMFMMDLSDLTPRGEGNRDYRAPEVRSITRLTVGTLAVLMGGVVILVLI